MIVKDIIGQYKKKREEFRTIKNLISTVSNISNNNKANQVLDKLIIWKSEVEQDLGRLHMEYLDYRPQGNIEGEYK